MEHLLLPHHSHTLLLAVMKIVGSGGRSVQMFYLKVACGTITALVKQVHSMQINSITAR